MTLKQIEEDVERRRAEMRAAFEKRGQAALDELTKAELFSLLGDKLVEMLPIHLRSLSDSNLPTDADDWTRHQAQCDAIGKEISERDASAKERGR
jgi:hypothetical protein